MYTCITHTYTMSRFRIPETFMAIGRVAIIFVCENRTILGSKRTYFLNKPVGTSDHAIRDNPGGNTCYK